MSAYLEKSILIRKKNKAKQKQNKQKQANK